MAQKNYYVILEVPSTATFEEIKSSYRRLAKKYHPDKNIGNKAAEEYFKEVQEAYGILSNPEKRKKYDHKLAFGTRQQPQQRSSQSGPQYTGNAYQYAQQQAQYKQQQQQAYNQAKKKQPTKKEESASWQILVSVGIALVLLYFIISYSTEKNVVTVVSNSLSPEDSAMAMEIGNRAREPLVAQQTQTASLLSNYDSPYTTFFGEESYDEESKSSISFLNGGETEAIICLVDRNTGKTLRNIYVGSESQIKMNQIPNGNYSFRIYFGNGWNPEKTFAGVAVKGGFKIENGFREFHSDDQGILMKKDKNGALDSFSAYEIKIRPEDQQNSRSITAREFFKK